MDVLRLLKYLSLAAALTFNNWLLGIFINHRLFLAGGSVSEFSAKTQPHAWLFRSLDITSGCLLVLLAVLIYRLHKDRRYFNWLALGIATLGAANCLDAILPLPCSGTLDANCSAPVRINLQRVSLPDHVFSSTIIGICYVLIPLAVLLYARRGSYKKLGILSAACLAITLVFFFFLIAESFFENGLIEHFAGYSQELQMLILGWLFFGVSVQAVTEKTP